MNDDKRKRMAELQTQSDDQDRQAEEREHQHAVELLDVALAPAANPVTASIIQPAEQLAELDLISEENPATPRWRVPGCGTTAATSTRCSMNTGCRSSGGRPTGRTC